MTAPWRIGCLRATGHPEQALALYEDARIADWAHVWLHAMVGPEILIDLGRPDEARAALRRGREMTRSSRLGGVRDAERADRGEDGGAPQP